jgi:hypothetical protein
LDDFSVLAERIHAEFSRLRDVKRQRRKLERGEEEEEEKEEGEDEKEKETEGDEIVLD